MFSWKLPRKIYENIELKWELYAQQLSKNLHNSSVIAIWRITIPINKMFSVGQVVIKVDGPSWSWSYGNWIYIYNYLCNQCLSPLTLFESPYCEVYSTEHYVIKFVSDLQQVGGFSPGTPVSSTDITELVLKWC
jgi:hypothetical protein